LLTQKVQASKHKGSDQKQFLHLGFKQAPGENLWLFLWDGDHDLPTNFNDLLEHLLIKKLRGASTYCPKQSLKISNQDIHQTPYGCLKKWNDDNELTDKQKKQIAMQLKLLDELPRGMENAPMQSIFGRFKNEAIFERSDLKLNFWRNSFEREVTLENMDALLENTLEFGFNWVAESDWPQKTLEIIRHRLKQNRQTWTKGRKNDLKQICPPLMDLLEISRGYPLTRSKDILLSHLDRSLVNLQNPQVFSVSFVESDVDGYRNGIGWRKIDIKGIQLHGIPQPRRVDFNYHSAVTAMDPRGNMCRLKLLINNEDQTIHYLCDKMLTLDGSLLGEVDLERINQIFDDAILASYEITGREEERSLAYLIRLCVRGFNKLSECDGDQSNRAVIFKVAVLVRLHAWFRNQYPVNWPLDPESQHSNYDFACALTHQIWKNHNSRDAFCSDVAGTEWLLAWFHLD
jgi:hypothetical protein